MGDELYPSGTEFRFPYRTSVIFLDAAKNVSSLSKVSFNGNSIFLQKHGYVQYILAKIMRIHDFGHLCIADPAFPEKNLRRQILSIE